MKLNHFLFIFTFPQHLAFRPFIRKVGTSTNVLGLGYDDSYQSDEGVLNQEMMLEIESKIVNYSLPPLLTAIKNGDFNFINSLATDYKIQRKYAHETDFQGNNAIQFSLIHKSKVMFYSMLDFYKDKVLDQNDQGDTILHLAVEQTNDDALKRILVLDIELNRKKELLFTVNDLGMLPLALAGACGDLDKFQVLLRYYQDYAEELCEYIPHAIELTRISKMSIEKKRLSSDCGFFSSGQKALSQTDRSKLVHNYNVILKLLNDLYPQFGYEEDNWKPLTLL